MTFAVYLQALKEAVDDWAEAEQRLRTASYSLDDADVYVDDSRVVLLLAGAYFLLPIDLLPEALLGTLGPVGLVGYLDDVVLLAVGSLPLGGRLLGMMKGLTRRGRAGG